MSIDASDGLLRSRLLDPPSRLGLMACLDRFDVLRVIGTGGMGVVVLARDPNAPGLVAVKLLRPELVHEPEAVRRFLGEARHMQQMSHPNILNVSEVTDRSDGPYFVMPFMSRGSLAELIRPGEPLDSALSLQIAREIAGALSYAHSRGITHRDLKPGNVLLDGEGHAFLADFGLLRTFGNDSVIDVRRSQREGTAPYMSPAVAAGEAEDTRCDIYSFGAMLYELLTGWPPYEGKTTEEILARVLAGPPVPILERNPDADPGLVEVAEPAMARELRDRYAQMADAVTDLEKCSARSGLPAPWSDFIARHRFTVNLLIHNVLFALALFVAYLIWAEGFRSLRTNWFPKRYLPQLPLFLLAKSLIFGWLKLFRGRWQHASIRDLAKILLGSWVFLMVAYAVVVLLKLATKLLERTPIDHSDGILVLDFMATVFLVGTARLGARLYHEEFRSFSTKAQREGPK